MSLTPSNDFVAKEAAMCVWQKHRVSLLKESIANVITDTTLSEIIEMTGLFSSREGCIAYFNRHPIYVSTCLSLFFTGETLSRLDHRVLKALLTIDKSRNRESQTVQFRTLTAVACAPSLEALVDSLLRIRQCSIILSLSNPDPDPNRFVRFSKYECQLHFLDSFLLNWKQTAIFFSLDPMLHELFND